MDEEAVHGSWAAVVADNGGANGDEESVTSARDRFTSLSRRINSSSGVKRCLFFGGVFVVLSSIGLAGVGLGMVLHKGGYFVKDVSVQEFSAVGGQVERSSDDDLIGECGNRIVVCLHNKMMCVHLMLYCISSTHL